MLLLMSDLKLVELIPCVVSGGALSEVLNEPRQRMARVSCSARPSRPRERTRYKTLIESTEVSLR